MSTQRFSGDDHEVWMTETEATRLIEPSRLKLAGDVLWLGFTAFFFAVILVIVCWPLSAELSGHNSPGAVMSKPAAGLTSGTSTASAAAPSLPALAGGDRFTRGGALPTPAADIGEGSRSVAPPSPAAAPVEPAGLSLTSPDSSPQTAQSVSAPAAESSPGIHRPPQHKPRARPVAPKTPAQLSPW